MPEPSASATPFTNLIKAAGGEESYWIEWNDLQIPIIVADYMAELTAGRESVAMVDTSGLQKLRISGADAGQFLDYLSVKPVSNLTPGRVAYTVLVAEDGMLRDDITVFRQTDESFLVASGTNLMDWAQGFSGNYNLVIEDASRDWCTLSVFGPGSYAFLQAAGIAYLDSLRAFHFTSAALAGVSFNVSRTGFSGGLGYELWIPWNQGGTVLEHLLASPKADTAQFSGVGALDILRTEAGYLMPGHDFPLQGVGDDAGSDQLRSPYDVGLGWLVKTDRGDFIGRDSLLAEADGKSRFELFAVELDIDEELETLKGLNLATEGGDNLGELFNGGFSLMMGKYIGMCCLPRGSASAGTAVVAGDNKWPGVLKDSPLYSSELRTKTPPVE